MDIRKIMQIARIHLEEEQMQAAQNKLDIMYSWLESIKKVDVSGVDVKDVDDCYFAKT